MKKDMLLDYCIGRAASTIKEFYLLPVGGKLVKYDALAVNTIVKNREGEVSSCDILYTKDLDEIARLLPVPPHTDGRCPCRQIPG